MWFMYASNGNLQNYRKTGKVRQIGDRLKKPDLNVFYK
jgi:hypothetical protein